MTTPQFPLYIGRNRALIRLQTGGVVCVDTNSRDSLDYLLGWRVEEHIFPVFRRFLHADSTVLDIGANVGLYTVTAGNVVRGSGRLYSFEGNPHTFELLKLSAYSNKLLSRPNIVLVNALVGARPRHALFQSRGTWRRDHDRNRSMGQQT